MRKILISLAVLLLFVSCNTFTKGQQNDNSNYRVMNEKFPFEGSWKWENIEKTGENVQETYIEYIFSGSEFTTTQLVIYNGDSSEGPYSGSATYSGTFTFDTKENIANGTIYFTDNTGLKWSQDFILNISSKLMIIDGALQVIILGLELEQPDPLGLLVTDFGAGLTPFNR